MKIFRYYYEQSSQYPKSGFLIRLDYLMKLSNEKISDEIFKLVAIFEDELDAPDCILYTTNPTATSWFTEKGNRKFKKAINKIKTYLQINFNQEMVCITKEIDKNDKNILYIDKYQVVLKE